MRGAREIKRGNRRDRKENFGGDRESDIARTREREI